MMDTPHQERLIFSKENMNFWDQFAQPTRRKEEYLVGQQLVDIVKQRHRKVINYRQGLYKIARPHAHFFDLFRRILKRDMIAKILAVEVLVSELFTMGIIQNIVIVSRP